MSIDLDLSIIPRALPFLLTGAWLTLRLTTLSVSIGLIIGSFAGIARVSRSKPIRIAASLYIDFIRGTPLLVQIFLIYFGLPTIIGRPVIPFIAALTALAINSGAYIAEIVRAGIESIDRGQSEAARSLGMTYAQSMRYIIFPQALRRIIPPLGNEFIAMLKDSSLVSVIAMEELLRRGQIVITRTFRPFEIYAVVAVMYLTMTFVISQVVRWSERRLKVSD